MDNVVNENTIVSVRAVRTVFYWLQSTVIAFQAVQIN